MNYRRILSKFAWKLRVEALLKAILSSFVLGFGAGTIASVVIRIIPDFPRIDILTMIVYSLCFSGLTVIPLFLAYMPTLKSAATRVDESGLDERIRTMLVLRNDNSYIASVQRRDALDAIGKTKSSAISFKLTIRPIIVMITLLLIMSVVNLFGYTTTPVVDAEPISEQIIIENSIINSLVKQLRETIDISKLSNELKYELNTIVTELEESVDSYDTNLIKIAKLSMVNNAFNNIKNRESGKTYFEDILLDSDNSLLVTLGQAIQEKNYRILHNAIENIRDSFFSFTNDLDRKLWMIDFCYSLECAIKSAEIQDEGEINPLIISTNALLESFNHAITIYDKVDENATEEVTETVQVIVGVALSDSEEFIADFFSINDETEITIDKLTAAVIAASKEIAGKNKHDSVTESLNEILDNNIEGDSSHDSNTSFDDLSSNDNTSSNDDDNNNIKTEGSTFFDPSVIEKFDGEDYPLSDEDFIKETVKQIADEAKKNTEDSFFDYSQQAMEEILRNEFPESLKEVIIHYFTTIH